MELKKYQSSALETFEAWLRALDEARLESIKASEALEQANISAPWEILNYPKKAWDALKKEGEIPDRPGYEYVDRKDETGQSIPHVCFKVPTGGGKTLMAASALERLNRQTGLTLWIVPSTAIYDQTKKALWRRAHPYRKMLERASGGRVKVLEKKKIEQGKDSVFTRSDVDNFLCVMLMTYQALNRTNNREFLRLFRNSSKYASFFPDSDDYTAHENLKKQYPDLKMQTISEIDQNQVVVRSLHNVFKMMRPVVVLDEAHKTVGPSRQIEEVNRSVRELNPSLILEISATPKPGVSNLLVNIGGVPLHNEEMIKLPIWIGASDEIDWHETLKNAHTEMENLAAEATNLYESEGRYIRPIAVVRVERTGKTQRGSGYIHAEDAREYLLDNLGVRPEEVAVKSSELDELGQQDLLSEACPIRWIITRDALKEGWDCSFAYMLVMLDKTTEKNAVAQLVGRILRQPHARRTGRKALDHCYVHCWNTNVGAVVSKVKSGLEREGLTGLVGAARSSSKDAQHVTIERRKAFLDEQIPLPKLMHKDESGWIEFNYDMHILSEIDWNEIAAPPAQGSMPQPSRIYTTGVDLSDSGVLTTQDFGYSEIKVDKRFNLEWYARRLSDIVPNPWQAARIAMEYVEKIRSNYSEDTLYDHRAWIVYYLRMYVKNKIERIAKGIYCDKLNPDNGILQFGPNSGHQINNDPFKKLFDEDDHSLERSPGQPIQRSLFNPMMVSEFDSDLERDIARYLDEQKVIRWWDRISALRSGEYYLRGWKRERIYPDFIAARQREGEKRLLVLETKGDHLRGNRDTEYKKEVLKVLQDAYNHSASPGQGYFQKGTFRLVYDKADLALALGSMDAEAQPLSA